MVEGFRKSRGEVRSTTDSHEKEPEGLGSQRNQSFDKSDAVLVSWDSLAPRLWVMGIKPPLAEGHSSSAVSSGEAQVSGTRMEEVGEVFSFVAVGPATSLERFGMGEEGKVGSGQRKRE